MKSRQAVGKEYLKSYVLGFVLSILLTIGAYLLVVQHLLSGFLLNLTLFSVGILQMIVQLLLFLHLGKEAKPRSKLLTFSFMLLVLVIIVGGSLWIMNNLNYNVMPKM